MINSDIINQPCDFEGVISTLEMVASFGLGTRVCIEVKVMAHLSIKQVP